MTLDGKTNKPNVKRIVKASAILIIAAGLFMTLWRCSSRSYESRDQELECLVSEFVEKDKSVRNCVLSLMKGDGSFSWSGAAGIANRDGQTPMTKNTPFYIASVTKLYTAAAIMRLYEKGALSLDDPMSRYLPKRLIKGIHVYKGQDYSDEITIKQLISHSSGIPDYYTEKPKGGKCLFELLLEDPARQWTVDEVIERARDHLEPNFRPGAGASYSDTNFQLLGKVIEAVTGKSLQVVYDDFFFRPLSLKHSWLVGLSEPQVAVSAAPADVFYGDKLITNIRSNGAYWADGGVVSTAEECIVFLKALNEGRIVRKDTLELMRNWRKLEFPLEYGYGIMRFRLPWPINAALRFPPLWGHSGSTGSFLYYCEDMNLYIAGTINQVESKSKPFRLMLRAIKAVRSEMKLQQSKTAN